MFLLLGCLAAIALCVVALTPRSSAIEGSLLKVRCLLFTFRFELANALEIQEVSANDLVRWNTLRVCGVGWPFEPFGWFYNKHLGFFLNLADDPRQMYLIRLPHRRLVVSPPGFGEFKIVEGAGLAG